jgi:hypothetical protein
VIVSAVGLTHSYFFTSTAVSQVDKRPVAVAAEGVGISLFVHSAGYRSLERSAHS